MLRVTVIVTLWLIAVATAEDQRKELKDEIDEANQQGTEHVARIHASFYIVRKCNARHLHIQ